jgi:hypothetical protein
MLEVLNLSHQHMTRREVATLLRALQDHKTIRELNLAGNDLGDAGAESFAAMLHTDVLLERLDMSANALTDRGVAHLARAIAANGQLALADLRLCDNHLTDSSCAHLAQCVKSNSTLVHVDLSGNSKISANGRHILKAMASRPALVDAGKAAAAPSLSPPGEVQLMDVRLMDKRSSNGSSNGSAAVLASRTGAAFTLAAPTSALAHVEPANFSAPNSAQKTMLDSAADGGAADFSSPRAAGLSRKGQAKQAELLSHEQRMQMELEGQLARLRAQKAEDVSAQLLEQVFLLLRSDDAQMARFVDLSVAFRQGGLGVSSFYSYALESLRFRGLCACIPAMLVTLQSAPEKQAQLQRAHIEYLCVKALLAEKKQAHANGDHSALASSTFGGLPSSASDATTATPVASSFASSSAGSSALDVLRGRPASDAEDDEDEEEQSSSSIFPPLATFPQQQAPPLFPPTPTMQQQQQLPFPLPSLPADLGAAIRSAKSPVVKPAVAPAFVPNVPSAAVAAADPVATPSGSAVTVACPASGVSGASTPPFDTSVQFRLMQEKLARAQAADKAARRAKEEREAAAAAAAAAEAKKAKEEEAAKKKAAEAAARKAEEQRKREDEQRKKDEAAAAKRAAEAARAAAAEAERLRRESEKAEKARVEREKREAAEAAVRQKEAQLAAERAEAAAAEAAARAAEAAAHAAREEEERQARRARRNAELEEAARAAEEARLAEEEAARKKARKEARELERERARAAAEREAAAEEAEAARKRDKEAENLRRLVAEAADAATTNDAEQVAAAAAAEAERIALLDELEDRLPSASSAPSAGENALSPEEKEAKRIRKEEKRVKRAAKEARKIEREKLAAQQAPQPVVPPPTQFHTPTPPAAAGGASAASSSSSSSGGGLAEQVSRWAARFTPQLPPIFVPPVPPSMPDVPAAASSSFIPYEDEVKLQRQEAQKRARISALHQAYSQAVADAAKRDRDQANIKPDVLPLLLNLHAIFPVVDETTGKATSAPWPFSTALQGDGASPSAAAIKKAFLKASLVVHPDKQTGRDAQRTALSSLVFPLLQASYQHFVSKQ